ncbi:MAG: class I SAM-dependent methyltransferase [candidate division Zixibacteria bacterium]|nr:class I SAM-dependent methyltransferase [candidate division Zixibacteria bacterium]
MDFSNSYQDSTRAEAYAKLEFRDTYHLAYRDLPEIIRQHTGGTNALDFGCGTGRSTRFVQKLGFNAAGVDISGEMVAKARKIDPGGEYLVIRDGDFTPLGARRFDLITAIFTFDNIPSVERRTSLLRGLRALLASGGTIILLDSTPDMYCNEWASFSSVQFVENRTAKSGDIVRTIIKGIGDNRPVEDILWTDADYRQLFTRSGLELAATYLPLAKADEPYEWVSETQIAPWVIYVTK